MMRFSFLAPMQMLSANDRLHWTVRNTRTRIWRQAAYIHALRAKRGIRTVWPWPHARIVMTIAWPDDRRRDVGNYQLTAKAIVDGIVDAGILRDDSDKYLTGPDLRRGPRRDGPAPLVVVDITREDQA